VSLTTVIARVSELSARLDTVAAEAPKAAVAPTSFATTLENAQAPRADAGRYDGLIERAAQREGIDPELVKAVVQHESGFDPRATSPAGAMGLMQLMPATARGLGVTDPYDPAQSIAAGTRMLSRLVKRYDGDLSLALAAYNAGSGAVERYGGVPPYRETQNYVRNVLATYDEARGTTGRSSG